MKRGSLRGFTLIEMLTVIVIVTILAALIVGAAMTAIDSGKRTQAQTDINGLYNAFREYETKYGAYAPTAKDAGNNNMFVSDDKILISGMEFLTQKGLYTYDNSQTDGTNFEDPWGHDYVVASGSSGLPDDIKGLRSSSDSISSVYYIYSYGTDDPSSPSDKTQWAYVKRK